MKRNTFWGLLLCINTFFLLINGSMTLQFNETWLLSAFATVVSCVGVAMCIDSLRAE